MVVLACIDSVVNGLFILAFLREMGREVTFIRLRMRLSFELSDMLFL